MGKGPRTVAILAGYAPSIVNFRGVLVESISACGHRVVAIAPPERGWADRIAALGAAYVPIEFGRSSIDPIGDLRARREIGRVLKERRVDVLLAYTIKPIVHGIPAAASAGVPSRVALVTGLGYAFGQEGLKQKLVAAVAGRLYRTALHRATAVRFQNPDDQELFEDRGYVAPGSSAVVAGSGVDLAAFPAVSPPDSSGVRFLLVARLLAEKGVREFVQAARAVHAERPDTSFHIVGPTDPNPLAIRVDEIHRWRNEGIVNIHPATDDVRSHFAACDVYVLPSYYREGTPRTVLEAMATGRPIITTDAPGCRETTIDGENGFLVPPKHADALADAMMRLIDDPALRRRMGQRSREIAEAKYDVHKVNVEMMRAMGLIP